MCGNRREKVRSTANWLPINCGLYLHVSCADPVTGNAAFKSREGPDPTMLIIPYQTRFSARSLAGGDARSDRGQFLVYLVFQGGDQKAYERATNYYFNSQLPQIELPRYAAYLETRVRHRVRCRCCARSAPELPTPRPGPCWRRWRTIAASCAISMAVRSSEPTIRARRWREQRARFNSLASQVFTQRFSLEPGSVAGCS